MFSRILTSILARLQVEEISGVLRSISAAYLDAARHAPWLLPCIGVAILYFVPAVSRRVDALATGRLRALFWCGLVALAVAWAVLLASIYDDAYISFRYADNLAHGRGLVFNVGERVEGYTNFLWTVLLAGVIKSGLNVEWTALILSVLCFVAEIALVVRIGRRVDATRGAIPLAAMWLAMNYSFASYATTGLETMFCTLLMTLALERALAGSLLAAGTAGIAATLGHPDHAILYTALGAAIWLDRDVRRKMFRYVLPLLLIYVPYFLLRWRYYGDVFPNTFYAKSGGQSYFSQGTVYLFACLLGTGAWAILPLAIPAAWRRRRELFARYALVGVPVWLIYVARIGGDFMLGRLVVPVLPIVLLCAEAGVRDRFRLGPSALRPVWIGLLAGIALAPIRLLPPREIHWQLADERTFYPVASWFPLRVQSAVESRASFVDRHYLERGMRPRLAEANVGVIGYRTGLEIIDGLGLTDRTVAHQPLAARGRPGHEKIVSADYLRARGVDLSAYPLFPAPYAELTKLDIGTSDYYFGRWQSSLVEPLRDDRQVAFVDFPKYLDAYVTDLDRKPAADIGRDLAFFDRYYFAGNPDSVRRDAITAHLRRADPVR